ncbi:MAG TPA: glycosyltransferase [Candidatus Acidoferrum sp.]|jgi:glycosyltransferase involved in cell wall biosynthesis|nr:glycosyltransferase [Candidatus Acidoferrum sp.]
MPESPLVSLLIPTHNNGGTVGESIESCLRQTFKDLEILVYDEASGDKTREVLNGYVSRDARIRVMTSDSNSGPLRAWRKLLHEARGRYCTFVWSDDLILPRYVETLVRVLLDNPKDLLAGCNAFRYYLPDDPKTPIEPANLDQPNPKWELLNERYATARLKGDAYALGIFAKIFPVTQMCNLFVTAAAREVFDHYIDIPNPYGFDYSRLAYGNDVAFLSELGLRSGELVQVGEPLVVARSTSGSLTERLIHTNRWQYWLQYTYAFYAGWSQCRQLSPRMGALIRAAADRVHFCDFFYSLKKRRWPRAGNPFKAARAVWFILREDRHVRKDASAETMERWLQRRS